jgi:hypothetical protein
MPAVSSSPIASTTTSQSAPGPSQSSSTGVSTLPMAASNASSAVLTSGTSSVASKPEAAANAQACGCSLVGSTSGPARPLKGLAGLLALVQWRLVRRKRQAIVAPRPNANA